MHTIFRSSTAASALIAVLLAGCGGGGHGSALPSGAAPGAPVNNGSSVQRAAATFTLVIPSGGSKSAARRSPKYISAAAASIGIDVIPVAGGPDVSGGINVNSTTCPTVAGAETCTLTVQAPVGSDTFTIVVYDAAGETGNVLGTGTETKTVVQDTANVFPLTLSGQVASVALALGTPGLPYISGGTTTVVVSAYDASGEMIVGSYSYPVSLSQPAGVTLSTAYVDSSGTSVTATYNGVSATPLQITAASQNASGATVTASAAIVPVTHVVNYAGATASAGGKADTFRIIKGPDGNFYFGDLGATQSSGSNQIVTATMPGAIGQVNAQTGVVTEVAIGGVDPVGLAFNGNDLYFCELASGTVGRITGAASGGFSAANYSEQKLPNGPPSGLTPGTNYDAPRDIVVVNGKLYVSTYYARGMVIIDPAQWSTTSTAAVTEVPYNGNDAGYTAGIAYAPSANVINIITTNWDVLQYTPGSNAASLSDLGYLYSGGQVSSIQGSGRFVTLGGDGNFYYTINAGGDLQQSGGIFKAAPTQNFSTMGISQMLAVPIPGWGPDSIHAGSTSTIVAGDTGYGSVDVYNYTTGDFELYAIPAQVDNLQNTGAEDVADDGNGSYWFSYGVSVGETLSSNATIGRLALAGWNVLPETTATQVIDGTGPNSATLVTIAGTQTSTVSLETLGGTCTIKNANASANSYILTGTNPGTCIVSATDGTRTITRTYTVTSNSATITSHRRISK